MDTIMQANHDGIVLLDRNGLVDACNARAVMLLGLEPVTAVGQNLMTIAPRLTTISPGDDTTLIEVSRNREEPLST